MNQELLKMSLEIKEGGFDCVAATNINLQVLPEKEQKRFNKLTEEMLMIINRNIVKGLTDEGLKFKEGKITRVTQDNSTETGTINQ